MRLLISGGASGGHVSAALAVAAEFREAHRDSEVLIVGRTGSVEEELVPREGFRLETIHVRGWDRDSRWKNIRLPAVLPPAFAHGLRIVDRFRPDVALGVGAHAMVPCLWAARRRRVPYVLQVSEPTGLANRILRSGAAAACVSFPSDVAAFPTRCTVVTGYPIRRGFAPRRPNVPPRRLLVMGGSHGARRINETVWEGLDALLARFDEVVHLTGAQGRSRSLALARPGYRPIWWTDDVANLMRQTDLVVARAGLGTCAELLAVGLPAILVPGTFGGGHQELHAARLESAGAGVRIADAELTVGRLLDVVDGLDPQRLQRMSDAAVRLARPGAARAIVRVLEEVAMDACGRWTAVPSGLVGADGVGEPGREPQALELVADLGEQVGAAEVVGQVDGVAGGPAGGRGVAALERPLGLQDGQACEVVEVAMSASELASACQEGLHVPGAL
jgi:UDP-N-acetylglucosamine--N-acetylmuramyl-(pentapeptide) pyrophosphoryl-undecaprenol N-acetylglucosamine transferase